MKTLQDLADDALALSYNRALRIAAPVNQMGADIERLKPV
jgi:hypothetical protein